MEDKVSLTEAEKRFVLFYLLAPWKGQFTQQDKRQYSRALKFVELKKVNLWIKFLVWIDRIVFRI